jgi:PadR family transcriptional regulator PadR
VPISKEIQESTGRDVLLTSVYAALERLEEKGLVSWAMGEPTPERGGRAKKYFHITAEGLGQVRHAKLALTRLWKGMPELQGGTT